MDLEQVATGSNHNFGEFKVSGIKIVQFENNISILWRIGLGKSRECSLEAIDTVSSKTLNEFKSFGFKNIKVGCF